MPSTISFMRLDGVDGESRRDTDSDILDVPVTIKHEIIPPNPQPADDLSALTRAEEEDKPNDLLIGGDGADVLRGNASNETLSPLAADSGPEVVVAAATTDSSIPDLSQQAAASAGGYNDELAWSAAWLYKATSDDGTGTGTPPERDDIDLFSGGLAEFDVSGSLETAGLEVIVAAATTETATPQRMLRDEKPDDWLPEPLSDTITGTNEDELLVGTEGGDTILGEGGDDILSGRAGNDQIFGGQGNDTLLGGEGDDTLEGGHGSDVFTGGEGSDTFAFVQPQGIYAGIDTITDYEMGVDSFQFSSDFLNVAPGETHIENVIALEGDGGAELWADVGNIGLTQIAFVEDLTAAQLQTELDQASFIF